MACGAQPVQVNCVQLGANAFQHVTRTTPSDIPSNGQRLRNGRLSGRATPSQLWMYPAGTGKEEFKEEFKEVSNVVLFLCGFCHLGCPNCCYRVVLHHRPAARS